MLIILDTYCWKAMSNTEERLGNTASMIMFNRKNVGIMYGKY